MFTLTRIHRGRYTFDANIYENILSKDVHFWYVLAATIEFGHIRL